MPGGVAHQHNIPINQNKQQCADRDDSVRRQRDLVLLDLCSKGGREVHFQLNL
jgi:hypothetical protein